MTIGEESGLITGRWVALDRLRPQHIDAVHRLVHAEASVSRWPLLGTSMSHQTLQNYLWTISGTQFAIRRTDSGEIIGLVQALDEDLRNQTASVGLVLDPTVWSKGWPFEATVLFVDYLFNTCDYRKLYFKMRRSTWMGIGRVANVWTKLECVYERHELNGEDFEDVLILSLFKRDWTGHPARDLLSLGEEAAGGGVTPRRAMSMADFELQIRDILDDDVTGDGQSLCASDELGLDSLQAFELVARIERLAGASPRDHARPQLVTLGDAYVFYEALLRDSHPSA